MQYMDFSLLLYIGMLALGVLVGSRKAVRTRKLTWLGRLQSVALIALIAVLGWRSAPTTKSSPLLVKSAFPLWSSPSLPWPAPAGRHPGPPPSGSGQPGRTSSQREEHEEEVKGA